MCLCAEDQRCVQLIVKLGNVVSVLRSAAHLVISWLQDGEYICLVQLLIIFKVKGVVYAQWSFYWPSPYYLRQKQIDWSKKSDHISFFQSILWVFAKKMDDVLFPYAWLACQEPQLMSRHHQPSPQTAGDSSEAPGIYTEVGIYERKKKKKVFHFKIKEKKK